MVQLSIVDLTLLVRPLDFADRSDVWQVVLQGGIHNVRACPL